MHEHGDLPAHSGPDGGHGLPDGGRGTVSNETGDGTGSAGAEPPGKGELPAGPLPEAEFPTGAEPPAVVEPLPEAELPAVAEHLPEAEPLPVAGPHPVSRRAEIAAGIGLSLAAGLGMFPLGVAFGLLVIQAGLPWWMAPALSVCVFAGSLELLLIGMMTAGTPLATVALTTFLVNFRHVFYAFSFPLKVVKNRFARAYSVYALIDEAYAVTVANPGRWTSWRLLSMQIAFQCYWVGGGVVGTLVASLLPGPIEGLEFALCALFVTLTLDACRTRRQVPSLLLAAVAFTAARILVPGAALFAGLLGFVGALVVRYLLAGMRERRADA